MRNGARGGSSSGYSYELSIDETVTHDSYFEAIGAWLRAKKEGEDQLINKGANDAFI